MTGKRRRNARLLLRGHTGGQRLGVVAGGNGDVAIRRDPHRKFSVHQVEAFGAKPSHQQRGARQPHLGFRRARHDRMVAIPDDDVADAHGDADSPCPLDLRAPDLDGIAVADIVLDRRCQPWRGHVQVDRAGAQTPPQPAEAAGEDHHQDRDHDGQTPHPAFPGKPSAQTADVVAEPMKPGIGARQQPARAMPRRLVMVVIPADIMPLRRLAVSARTGFLGRRIPCHCLSVLALRLIAAKAPLAGT